MVIVLLTPLVHLSLHTDAPPAATHRDGLPVDPAAALVGWTRRGPGVAMGLDGRRIAGLATSITLHLLGLVLLIGAAAPELPLALGESEVETLQIEFLPPAPAPVMVVPASRVSRIETPTVVPEPARVRSLEPIALLPVPAPVEAETVDPLPVATPPAATDLPVTPTAPSSAPSAEPPLDARGKRAQSQYLRELMAWLARHRVYPAEAKKQKLEGVVQVRFAIDRDGRLLSAAVHRSAGTELLDQAALDVLHRADPMPKFPKALARSRLSVTLPIDFTLITD